MIAIAYIMIGIVLLMVASTGSTLALDGWHLFIPNVVLDPSVVTDLR